MSSSVLQDKSQQSVEELKQTRGNCLSLWCHTDGPEDEHFQQNHESHQEDTENKVSANKSREKQPIDRKGSATRRYSFQVDSSNQPKKNNYGISLFVLLI